MRTFSRMLMVLVLGVAMLPPMASAQALALSDAAAFMGGWTLGLDTPQGAMSMELKIKKS